MGVPFFQSRSVISSQVRTSATASHDFSPMAPRIVVLCDGTWCGRETNTQTNIYLLAQILQVSITNLNPTDERGSTS